MNRRQFLPLAGLLLPGSAALAAPRREAAPAPKPLPVLPSLDADGKSSLTPEKRALVEKVRTSWRAADGRSAEEVVASLGGMVLKARPVPSTNLVSGIFGSAARRTAPVSAWAMLEP